MGKTHSLQKGLSPDTDAFFALLRAGLWETTGPSCIPDLQADFGEVYKLAEKQTVVGLIAAGLESFAGKVPPADAARFRETVQVLEQGNRDMNHSVEWLFSRLNEESIRAVLVKGAGIAQCYERPLSRSVGDIDLLLNGLNYERAKEVLTPFARHKQREGEYSKHYAMKIGPLTLELHGSMRTGLSNRVDRGIDAVQEHILSHGGVRIWQNARAAVPLPSPDDDAVIIFTHFLKHFYKGGIGLRQICDWCRLLWTYRDVLDIGLLKERLAEMGLTTEWKVFGSYAVDYLGMPAEAMPLYEKKLWRTRKAERVNRFILEVGNFGKSRAASYSGKKSYLVRKAVSFGFRLKDLVRHMRVFPLDSLRFFPSIMFKGLRAAVKQVH